LIKVFIIDDSILVRVTIKKIIKSCNEIEVLGEANNPVEAFEVFKKVGLPDVFILDIEMPKMDGITFLRKIKEQKPIPTIMCSSVIEHGSNNSIEALRLGACDIIIKPKIGLNNCIDDITDEFISKIKAAACSKSITIKDKSNNIINTPLMHTNKIVAIGSSTGGVHTLESIFTKLQANHAPIVVVQHMPEGFTYAFANSLNKLCIYSNVKEAQEGDVLHDGDILIAPGNKHMEIAKHNASDYIVVLKDYPKVSSHKPSVDVLFTSVANVLNKKAIAFILTGMGKDGAAGIMKIKNAGGVTYGQDEATSVVYGMPKVAFDIGALKMQVPLNKIADIINNL
jgi:two-component system chemotaxis response regulator CheB